MQAICIHFFVFLASAFLFGGFSLPVKEISETDLIKDETEVEVKKDIGIGDDKNTFDNIQKINEEKDVTGLYQGDIKKTPGEDELNNELNEKRNAINEKSKLWVGKVVPFTIDSALSDIAGLIQLALDDIQKSSCLTFVSRRNETNYLNFIKDQGCWSYVGRYLSGINTISIGDGCGYKGIIIHEVLHALGFWHEQSRSDRGNYIEIFWENIRQGVDYNFEKNTRHELLSDYDYDSLMHYGPYAFSSNGKKTIVPIRNPSAVIGQRDNLSAKDIAELNALYDCQSTSTDFYSTWGNWQPCDSYCYKKRQRFCSHTDYSKCPLVDSNGIQTETAACTSAECYPKIDGHWGRWTSWSTCSKSCDQGQLTRTRICNDPAPKNGGADCVGTATEANVCRKKSCFVGPDDCEFESDLCVWTNEATADQLDWTRHAGTTPSANTGPSGDHTGLGHGSYIYMEASSPATMGQKAVLISKTMKKPPSGRKCLTFWYHMYGAGMGTLKVILKDVVTMTETVLRTLSGDKGDKWNKYEFDVSMSNDFQIKFEAERGTSYESDIALDDIFFGLCDALGMEDKRIKDYQISSSSDWDLNHKPFYARLNQPGPLQWCAHWQKHGKDQFIRVDFDKKQLVSGISLQGQATYDNWVTSYKIIYTEDGYIWKTLKENGVDKIFTGSTSRNSPVKHSFAASIHAFGIMVNPQSFHGNDICLRMEIYGREDPAQPSIPSGCKTAVAPLGMASRKIPNSQITATSIWDSNHQAYEARLNNYKVWCVANNNVLQYLQIDLGKLMTIYAIGTQGHPTWDNYVTSYEVTYSQNGIAYYDVLNDSTSFTKRVFIGNKDRNSIVKHKFNPLIQGRFVRIHPKSFIGNDICMRAELYGCESV